MSPTCKALLKYLQTNRTITPLEALSALGCLSLSQRIGELRKQLGPGEQISARLIRTPTGKHVAEYNYVTADEWRGMAV